MDFPKSVPGVGLVGGQFVDENQTTGQVGSLIPAKWGNDVTTELLGVINEAGLVPDEENPQQLRAAVLAIVDKVAPVATKAEAETNDEATANNVKRMTPLRVLQAIKARLINATEAVVGMLRVGTQVEVDAGVLDGVAVTPKKLRWGFSASWTANGYIVFPSWLGGLAIQWGRVAPAARQADGTALGPISYPIQFPNAVFGVYGQMIGGEAVPLGSLDGFLFVKTVGLSSFNLISGFSAGATFEFGAYWVAFGR